MSYTFINMTDHFYGAVEAIAIGDNIGSLKRS